MDRAVQYVTTETGSIAGFVDGSMYQARFRSPHSLIKYARSENAMFLADSGNDAIRLIVIERQNTNTTTPIRSGLSSPHCLAMDRNEEFLFFTDLHRLGILVIFDELRILTGDHSPGYMNGELSEAKFSNPCGIIPLSPALILVADSNNNRLRLIDIEHNVVSSMCTGSDTDVDGEALNCTVNQPRSLVLKDGVVFVGQEKAIRVFKGKSVNLIYSKVVTSVFLSVCLQHIFETCIDMIILCLGQVALSTQCEII